MEQYWYTLSAAAALEHDEWLSTQSSGTVTRRAEHAPSVGPSVPQYFSAMPERMPTIRTPAHFSFRSLTPQPILNVIRTNNSLPRPLLPAHNGEFVPTKITIGEALYLLDRMFANRDTLANQTGLLSQFLESADPNAEIDPLLCLAIFSFGAVIEQDNFTERHIAETAMLGQALTNFMCNPTKIVSVNIERNGFPRPNTYHNVKRISKRAISALLEYGLIQHSDTVIDVGTGYGAIAKYLIKKGIDTTAIEPLFDEVYFQGILDAKMEQGKIIKDTKLIELNKIIRMTAEEYVRNNPGKRFSTVIACNFRPNTSRRSMIEALAALTKADGEGKALIGISCADPQAVAATPHNMQSYLEEYFSDVRYIHAYDISPSEFDIYFSVGGQMGFYECKRPMMRADDPADCFTM